MSLALMNLSLARAHLDRAAHLRTDEAALESLFAKGKVFQVHQGKFLFTKTLHWLEPPSAPEGERYFLGLDDSGTGYFAVNAPFAEGTENLQTLREAGLLATEIEIGAAVHAVALANWHDTHTHCARCGADTYSALAGSVRRCRSDESEHYPRTDSAVIVLVRDKDDRVLLGRQKVWPAKRYSNFAGFLEPGESLEACVKREVLEEAGVRISEIEYLGSQAWPFPASIMLAFTGIVENPEDAQADGEEIEDLRWYSREKFTADIKSCELLIPPGISIARRMIEAWYGGSIDFTESWR
jgi:NAD+ diphosphatase